MSGRELTRVEVLSRVQAGTLSLGSAAQVIGVSYRQVRRLARRYRAEGATGLRPRSAGRRSNHARAAKERTRVLALVREKYSGSIDERFGPTLAPSPWPRKTGSRCITIRCAGGCWRRASGVARARAGRPKGRVERNHGTHQDRRVKKLRRLGIAEAAAANQFLEQTYLPEHNRRFAVAPASAEDFHRRRPAPPTLDRVFRLEEARVLSNDWVVRYATRYFQVARQSGQPPARSTVLVREARDGAIELRYRGRLIQWTEISAPVKPPPPAARPRRSSAPHRPARPSADHPWRRDAWPIYREEARAWATQP